MILLTGFHTPASLRSAGTDGVTEYLHPHRAWAPGIHAMATTTVALANQQSVALPGEKLTALLTARPDNQLLELDREIKDLDIQRTNRFEQHPPAGSITSIDGFGPILGAEMLADTAENLIAAFGTSAGLAAHAGLPPVPRDPERVRDSLRRPKRYHRGLRRVFYLAALSAIKRKDEPSRAFYLRKRDERTRHTQALIALARRLVDLVWALIRDNRTFTTEAPAPIATAT